MKFAKLTTIRIHNIPTETTEQNILQDALERALTHDGAILPDHYQVSCG